MKEFIVIEPQTLLRMGLIQVLSNMEPGSQIEGIDHCGAGQETRKDREVDLVLLSISKDEVVAEAVRAVEEVYAPKWMLLLSESAAPSHFMQAWPHVVGGYVHKYSTPEVLAASVRLVEAGGKCFPSPLTFKVAPTNGSSPISVARHAQASRDDSTEIPAFATSNSRRRPTNLSLAEGNGFESRTPPPTLTDIEARMLNITQRQYEVLVLLAQGHPIKTIGRQLNISVATAKAHAETLYQRMGVHNRSEAVYAAISRGATLGWSQTNSNAA